MPLRKLPIAEIDRLSPADYASAPATPLVAVLDNLRSRSNVGVIFRSADAFRLAHLHLCGYTPAPPHREIRKTALGAEDVVPHTVHASTVGAIAQLRAAGYAIVALEHTAASTPLAAYRPPADKVALVLGNEVTGVEQAALDACDAALEIPQYGTKHSLNVAVAAGIAFYELHRILTV